jgi:hypothetical protein
MNALLTSIQVAFVALTLVYLFLFVRLFHLGISMSTRSPEQKKRLRVRIVISLILWILFVSAWSLSGIMSDFSKFPFNAAPVLIIPFIASIIFTFSRTTADILRHIPAEGILYLQSFRIFVELLLWGLFAASVLPVQMTFEGRNLDILTGLTGPIVGYLAARQRLSRTALVLWNIAGLGLLINIVAVAILSMPTPLRVFANEPANTIVTYFPISWLPGLLVPLAYTLHFLSLRQTLILKGQAAVRSQA